MAGSIETWERLERIERLLLIHPWTTTELAAELGVSQSTAYRNIQWLLANGRAIEWDEHRVKGRRYWISRDNAINRVRLTIDEAGALYVATRLLARMFDTSNPIVFSTLWKLSEPLEQSAPRIAAQIRGAAQLLRIRPEDQLSTDVFRALAQAWLQSRKVRMTYRSTHRTSERVVSPYLLEPVDTEQALYVVGHDDASNEIRTFKLDRILAIEVLHEEFAIPDDFDATTWLQSGWGIMGLDRGRRVERVVLQFRPEVALEIRERFWHPSQQLTDLDDGGCLLEVTVAHASEMLRWIRRWGLHQVRVLEPAELRH